MATISSVSLGILDLLVKSCGARRTTALLCNKGRRRCKVLIKIVSRLLEFLLIDISNGLA